MRFVLKLFGSGGFTHPMYLVRTAMEKTIISPFFQTARWRKLCNYPFLTVGENRFMSEIIFKPMMNIPAGMAIIKDSQ